VRNREAGLWPPVGVGLGATVAVPAPGSGGWQSRAYEGRGSVPGSGRSGGSVLWISWAGIRPIVADDGSRKKVVGRRIYKRRVRLRGGRELLAPLARAFWLGTVVGFGCSVRFFRLGRTRVVGFVERVHR